MGGITITTITYIGYGDYWDFHVPGYNNYYIGGVVSHNSGKSLTLAVLTARVARGMDPYFGNKRPLLIYCVGRDQNHIGRVIYRYLFKPNQIKLIIDKKTGLWRSYRPWEDADREHEIVAAPPFIPEECIDPKGWGFENKADRVFSVCRLYFGENHPMNGTEIRAFSSKAEPAMGDPVDLVWVDEDIDNIAWVTEMEARLADRKGKLVWGAYPLLRNEAMTKLSRRAEEQKANGSLITTEEFVLTFSANPFMDEETKTNQYANWTDEERRARDFGEYVTETILCYPEYERSLHCVPRKDDHTLDPLEVELEANKWKVPDTWTRWMAVDPGHTTLAVLFVAIPPPEVGDYVYVYDMCYIKSGSAKKFGEEVRRKVGSDVFQAFVIDNRAARQTQIAAGVKVGWQYTEALRENEIESVETHYGFYPGSDDVQGRMATVRSWMADREGKGPKLRIFAPKCMELLFEFAMFKKRLCYGKQAVDEPIPLNNHACNCLEYLAASTGMRHKAPPAKKGVNPAYANYQKMIESKGRGSVNLGPPTPSPTTF